MLAMPNSIEPLAPKPAPQDEPIGNNPPVDQSQPTPQVTSSDPALLNPSALPVSSAPDPGGGGNKSNGFHDFLAFLGVLATAGVLALLLITFVFRSYSVDGPSMETTLQDQDKLIIWKLPRTIAKVTGNQYVPGRGDVLVVFEDDLSACGQGEGREIIKRVIGLPGERVVVADGTITVYNQQFSGGFEPDKTLPYNDKNTIPFTDEDTEVILQDNELFLAGDNRPESCDSRRLGPITTDQVVGKLVVRLLPANNIKLF